MKTINYKDIKGDLKETFKEFMTDPAAFGVKDPEQIEAIEGAHGAKKHGMWKVFKKLAKLQVAEFNNEDLTDAFVLDLEEDGVTLTSGTLKVILKDPANEAYHLEPDMIEYIQGMSKEEKSELIQSVSENQHFGDILEGDGELTAGQKILEFLKNLWVKISPVLDKIFDALVDVGVALIEGVIEKSIQNDALQNALSDALEGAGDTLKDITGNEEVSLSGTDSAQDDSA